MVSCMENGKRVTTIAVWERVCAVLGVSIKDLLSCNFESFLTEFEVEIIKGYRLLSTAQRLEVLSVLHSL
jgi:hypothetical protein